MNLSSERTSAEGLSNSEICQFKIDQWLMGGGVGQGGFLLNVWTSSPFPQSEMNPSELGVVSQCQEKFCWESSELRRNKCRKKKTQQHNRRWPKIRWHNIGSLNIRPWESRRVEVPFLEVLHEMPLWETNPNRKCCAVQVDEFPDVLRLPNWARRAVSSSHASLATSE